MFRMIEDATGLGTEQSERILAVFQSMNEPKVSPVDRPAEQAQAYICVIREGAELDARIVLFLTQTRERILYGWGEGPFVEKMRNSVEDEALDFVENMGFMMDNVDLSQLDSSARQAVLQKLPIFEVPTPGQEPDIDATIETLDKEFGRDTGALDEELDSAVAFLAEEKEPSSDSQVRGWLRLLASL